MKESLRPAGITGREKITRAVSRVALAPILRQEIVNPESQGLARAEELHRDGYGIVVLINHFSRTDPIHAMRRIAGIEEFKDQQVVAPIAKHQAVPGLIAYSRINGIRLHKVVTAETVKKAIEKGKSGGAEKGQGVPAYLHAVVDILTKGGIVVIAPQGTRQSTLQYDEEEMQAVRATLIRTRHNPNIAFHFVAFGITGETDYSNRRKLNIGTQYQIHHGGTFTAGEALEQAGGLKNADRWAIEELAKIVPKEYLPK